MTQAEGMMSLCREHYKTDTDVTCRYVILLNNALSHSIDLRLEALLKQLDDIHDREVSELKKKLDIYNREEMKALAKKHKEKNELSRQVFMCLSQCFISVERFSIRHIEHYDANGNDTSEFDFMIN